MSDRRLRLKLHEHQRKTVGMDTHDREYSVDVGRACHGCVMVRINAWPVPDDIIQAQTGITLFLTPKQAQKMGQLVAGAGYMAEAHDEMDAFRRLDE